MIERDHSHITRPLWPKSHIDTKEDLHAADAQVAALNYYYQSSIQSLKSTEPSLDTSAIQATKKSDDKSLIEKFGDWFKSLFGYKNDKPVNDELSRENSANPNKNIPELQAPEIMGRKELNDKIASLNRELTQREKELAEFEEEMRKSPNKEHLIFGNLVKLSLSQKSLKELITGTHYENVFSQIEKNKQLQKKHHSLQEEIASIAKKNTLLKWIGVGITTLNGAVLGAAVYTLGLGAIFGSIPLAMLSIASAGKTGLGGFLKHKTELKNGELYVVGEERKNNTSVINEGLENAQDHNQEIGNLLKATRQLLSYYFEAGRNR